MELSDFSVSTAMLAGSYAQKLDAIKRAGFGSITQGAKDLISHPKGIDQALEELKLSGLRVNSFQLLRDFGGFEGRFLEYKLNLARTDLQLMERLGTDLLLVCSSTSPQASGDPELIASDLVTLSQLAGSMGKRIGYMPLAWGRWVNDYLKAWDIIQRADQPNLGLVLDSFHMIVAGSDMEPVLDLSSDKVFMVHLSDNIWNVMQSLDDLIDTARHHRVFPGEGGHGEAVIHLVCNLREIGYRGDYSFTVLNDDYLQCAPSAVLANARQSAEWIMDTIRCR